LGDAGELAAGGLGYESGSRVSGCWGVRRRFWSGWARGCGLGWSMFRRLGCMGVEDERVGWAELGKRLTGVRGNSFKQLYCLFN